MSERIVALYKAIIDVTDMDDIDKANLFETLHNIPHKQFVELEDVYINGNY